MGRLREQAERIRNTDAQSVHTMEVGDEWRQGDCRIIRLPDDFVTKQAKELVPVAAPAAQLVVGDTQGSRHVLAEMAGVTFYRLAKATALDGPVIHTPVANAVTHPEHGDVIDMPAGCYAFPGQRAFADTLRRVAD
jgi:hypothetical protein